MVEKEAKSKRKFFIVKIGPLLKGILDKQREMIMKATYNCVDSSDYEAGEIIAKKVAPII